MDGLGPAWSAVTGNFVFYDSFQGVILDWWECFSVFPGFAAEITIVLGIFNAGMRACGA